MKTIIAQHNDSTNAKDDDFEYEESYVSGLSDTYNFVYNNEANKNDLLIEFPKNVSWVGDILVDLDENQDYEMSYLRKFKKLVG